MNENGILIANFTTLFKREVLLYSLGDTKLPAPMPIKKVGYFILFAFIWILPIYLIVGIKLNFLFALFALIPPAALAHFAGKPIWGGMSLFAWIKTQVLYLMEAPFYTDLEANPKPKKIEQVPYTLWVGRRREMYYLSELGRK